jgi:FkbM family methyltransferase
MSNKEVISISYNNKDYKFYVPANKDSHINKNPPIYIDEFKQEANLISNFLQEGDYAIDIGARDGDSTLPIRAVVGEKGKVIAFEPNPYEYPNLIENIKLNKFDNVDAHSFGISKQNGELEFVFEENFYNGGLKTQQAMIANFPKSIKLLCKNWENLNASIKKDFEKVSFIKIDTEGSDIDILEEISEVIVRNKPFILMEWWPFTENRIIEFINKFGYIAFDKKTFSLVNYISISNRVENLFLIHVSRINRNVL